MMRSKLLLFPLGNYIQQCDERNTDNTLTVDDVRGLSTAKDIIETKANMDGVPVSNYKVVRPNWFAYVPDTSRRGDKMSLGYNNGKEVILVSSISQVFKVKDDTILLPDFLYLWFCRPEFDRYARFHSWGSAREAFSYEDMERVMIPVPSLEVQEEIVATWKGLRKIKEENEALAAPLFQLCQSKIQDLKHSLEPVEIGQYIEQSDDRNSNGMYTAEDVRGVSIEKRIIDTKANMEGVPVTSYKLFKPSEFCYVPVTSRNGDKITLALNQTASTFIVSGTYEVFRIKNNAAVLPDYLFMWFCRSEFDRLARFNSWGSARESFAFADMERVRVPIPDIEVQQAIVDIFNCARKAKQIAEEADKLSRDICPALMQKAIYT